MTNGYGYIDPPQMKWNVAAPPRPEMRMNQLIRPHVQGEPFDVGLLGVPLSRSSISPSAASENPNAIRMIWKSFAAYNIDYDTDLSTLRIVDLGDVKMHVTDIPRCHHNIEQGLLEVLDRNPPFLPVMIGGDHSITNPLVKAVKQHHRDKTIGIVQFDTHFDLRDLRDGGPSNGTPIRGLIESHTVSGQHVVNIGLHGYFNTYSLKQYADQHGVRYVTLREMKRKGIEQVVAEAVEYLRQRVDLIYVTVDIDVLDVAFAPAAPASTPGGMSPWELFDALYLLGKEPLVCGMDLVCLDPFRDHRHMGTVKTGAHAILNLLCGYMAR
ncbi:agmatinase family protein [Brevibacillus marinus]|uniref:agmatinase family protein n=1 Tax=Brevibacillus marinus TaxID=2496837 RepID=UPI000F847A58|nr:agmatinase family protein [Brevibacillus marinus]